MDTSYHLLRVVTLCFDSAEFVNVKNCTAGQTYVSDPVNSNVDSNGYISLCYDVYTYDKVEIVYL